MIQANKNHQGFALISILSIIALVLLLSTSLTQFSRFNAQQNTIETAYIQSQLTSANVLQMLLGHENINQISIECLSKNKCDLTPLIPASIQNRYEQISFYLKRPKNIALPIYSDNTTKAIDKITTEPANIKQYLFQAELQLNAAYSRQKSQLLYSLFLQNDHVLAPRTSCHALINETKLAFNCPHKPQFIGRHPKQNLNHSEQ